MAWSESIKSEALKAFFENPIFLSAVSSWFFAQLIKAIIVLLRSGRKTPREVLETLIWRTGGMPSSHSSLVSALTVSIALNEGVGSNLFVVTLFFSLVVMRDAMGVRRSAGIQAKTLNLLGRSAADRLGIEYTPVKEIHGHAPLEVVIGALLGIIIAAAVTYL
ncbi:divergent PAP2 family protein [Breznakiella homolactica]|uniref:Divergent PAP2 family protein n=1 Tax=Breznakiella homolactica TaxID=2798577 RepID=A0A7T7XKI5_9SPIR|nr:divergent PAP2 family protein [Breznakiella homolactica]QQO07947.1 divergent PAP2 family protein [Breznakiella homolactica]